ncbi:Peptide deformylase 1B, chloroplastic-like protein [Drosera capensis]
MAVSSINSLHFFTLSKSLSLSPSPLPTPCHRHRLLLTTRLLFSTTASTTTTTSLPLLRLRRLRRGVPVLAVSKREDIEFASRGDLRYEVPLSIVEYPDPRLRMRNKAIREFGDELKKLVDEMFDMMYKTDGIGLSAPQVGINVQLMVFNPAGERGEGQEIALINPRVVKYSKEKKVLNEGCLSFPGIYGDVQRPVSVTIDAQDVTGAKFRIDMSGIPARIFQHEFDHLKGILFFERMTETVLEEIRADLQALEEKYEKNTGTPSPEQIKKRNRPLSAVGFGKSK